MRTWSVTARGLASVQVQGRNWLVALGRGLHELGRVDELARLACEVLPNGTVIARDIATGTGYIVQGVDTPTGRVIPDSSPPAASSEPNSEDAMVRLIPASSVAVPPPGFTADSSHPDELSSELLGKSCRHGRRSGPAK